MQIKKKHIVILGIIVIGNLLFSQYRVPMLKLPKKNDFFTVLKDTISVEKKSTSKEKQTGNFSKKTNKDSLKKDSLSFAKDTLKIKSQLTDIVHYKAKDCVTISKKNKQIVLFNESEVKYEDTNLKAGISIINYDKNEVYAGRIKDSVGELTQTPVFSQADQIIEPDSIRFNYKTKRAIIRNAYTQQSENKVKANVIKKENDSTYFLKDGKVTTAEDLDDPDYYIHLYRAKLVPKKKIVAGFANMYIADVPTPIALPFAYYPMVDSRTSGVLFPTFGEVNDRGYFLQNGGYYFAINNFLDLTLTGDYYTNGSYGMRAASNYRKRYKYSGNFNLRYENLIFSQKGFPDYSRNSVYNIQWSHTQDSKSSPNSSFSASVNLGSSSYYRDSYNQLNSSNFINNTLSSSVSYSRTFSGYPSVNMSITASHSQNTNTKSVEMTLPAFRASVERIYPFAERGKPKKGILQNINLQYSVQADNHYSTHEDQFFRKEMFDKARNGLRHNIPISTNFKLFKYLSISASTSLNEIWQFRSIRYQDYNEITGKVQKDTLKGFSRYLTYNMGASAGTTIYGTFNFGKNKKIQAIRHIIRPSVSYGYAPSFDNYYNYYIADAFGSKKQYSPFEGGLYGAPSLSESNSMSFSVSNTFEAKVRSKDSTATEPKKVMLLNSLNFSSNYNFITNELSPISVTGGTQLFNNELGINFGATLNPYAIDNNGVQTKKWNIANGGSLFRVTNANLTLNYSFSSKNFNKRENTDNRASGGRKDDLFGSAMNTKTTSFAQDNEKKENEKDSEKNKHYYAAMPWDLRFAYSLSYSNFNRNPMISTNSLMISGNIDLTPKWRIGASTGYDFKDKGITYTQLRFERDLNSFHMSFNITPFGFHNSWNFFIGIKASMLSDLKWDKSKAPDRRLQ